LAEPALKQALAERPSPEKRRRIRELLELRERDVLAAEPLRALRAVQALEWADTSQARELLRTLAKGAPEARLTREARSSLERQARRRRD
jgi:hypothetical protein